MGQQIVSISPLLVCNKQPYYKIQGMDGDLIGSKSLFFADGEALFSKSHVFLKNNAWFATGTFRNSLFLEPILQMTSIRNLSLAVEYVGDMVLKLFSVTQGAPAVLFKEVRLSAKERTIFLMEISGSMSFPENTRLFWHIDGVKEGCNVFDVSYCTRTKPDPIRLAVQLRTFGRTDDVLALLRKFAHQSMNNSFYGEILKQIDFWVLDTTSGAAEKYQHHEFASLLNLTVITGPNLGGGGNAGHLMKLFEDNCESNSNYSDELLILDDDLSISMESIARYFMFVSYRNQEFLCSLPIMMKSRPLQVWEDGGFWGHLNFNEELRAGTTRSLAPTLIKHGLKLHSYGDVDNFNELNKCGYSTFIFYGMSFKTFKKLGYPVSFFLRGDDIEMSLRAQKNGLTMITNPNLVAWHEPAHSYGQEYMAILHGVIINLTYSEGGVEEYLKFFKERLFEHSSINDLVGIRLYKDILTELMNPNTLVLSKDFQMHYIPKLKEYGQISFNRLSSSLFGRLLCDAPHKNKRIVPFVYPGYHSHISTQEEIIAVNHGAQSYRVIEPVPLGEVLKESEDYLSSLRQFNEEFVDIQSRWRKKLKEVSQKAYWTEIQSRYQDETQFILNTERDIERYHDTIELVQDSNVAPLSDVNVYECSTQGLSIQDLGGSENQEEVLHRLSTSAVQPVMDKLENITNSVQMVEKNLYQHLTNAQSISSKEVVAVCDDIPKGFWAKLSAGLFSVKSDKKADLTALPPDFDAGYYLSVNRDVADSGMDAATHYLKYGKTEKRIYKP